MSERLFPIESIDDSIIQAVDESGAEILRLSVNIGDKVLKVRFPTWGEYDRYQQKNAELFSLLSQGADNIQLPDDLAAAFPQEDTFKSWTAFAAIACLNKKIRGLTDGIIFDFLRPELDGIAINSLPVPEKNKTIQWIRDNLGMDQAIHLFRIVLSMEELIKKKARLVLAGIFQVVIHPPSWLTSTKSLDGRPKSPQPKALSSFISI